MRVLDSLGRAIDLAIAPFAPAMALRRAQARAAFLHVRAYEGAQKNRRTQGWRAGTTGPVGEVRAGRSVLRDRSRDLVRNNAWIANAVSMKVANQVGTGIRARAATGNKELDKRIDALFAEWSQACAPESGGDLFSLQALAARTRCESGEGLVILDRTGGLTPAGVPLALQVLEPDWIADDMAGTAGARNGWRDGIRFDDAGLRSAYRLWQSNPAESGILFARRAAREVPAGDVIHLFRQDRPGQIRGVPDVASAMMRIRDLDDYHDAALMLAKVQALLGVFVTSAGGPADSSLGQPSTGASGERLEDLAPGMLAYLRPGEDVKFLAPEPGGPFAEYTRIALHLIAAGLETTYHELTGDLSDANYSSLRAGKIAVRRLLEQHQWLVLIPRLCRPIWNAFIAQAIIAGRLPGTAANAPAKWTPPRFEMVDPSRDTEALKSQVRAGLLTWPEAVAEQGYDPEEQLAEIKAWNAKLTDAGVVLDIDPRLTTGVGGPVNPAATSAVALKGD